MFVSLIDIKDLRASGQDMWGSLNNNTLRLIHTRHIIILKINRFISLQNMQLKLTQMVAIFFSLS